MDLKADKKSLRQLLSIEEQQFRIPPYQRPYSWTSEQVDDLWEDLLENAATGHFLGSLVLSSEDEFRPLIIDGQQRLTSLMILMSALRDACHDRGLTDLVARINKRLTADDLADGDGYFKFKTGTVNWPIFRDYVLRSPGDPKRRNLNSLDVLDHDTLARNANLIANLRRMRAHLASHLETVAPDGQAAWLKSFDSSLATKVELVVIEVRELADAFLLFETLNDRGLQLSAADLLKSHLLGQIAKKASEEEVEAAALEWDEMLEDLGVNVDVSRFLRHYLLGTLQTVKKDEVFGHFKSLVAKNDADWVLSDLRKAAKSYGEFEDPSKLKHEPTKRVLTDLQTLRATVCYIALLPARRYLSEEDFVEFAKVAETLTYRYSSVVGLGTNDLERRYRDAAQLLQKTQGGALQEARAELIGAMPDSATFRLAFESMRMGTQYLLRYTLGRIEEHVDPSVEKKLKANTLVHIEHVMPQKLSDSWREALGADVEFHDDYLNRYGNLTLLYWSLNIPASNNGFEDKKKHYEKSQVEITKMLLEQPTWGLAQIEARQKWLAEIADAVWAVPAAGASKHRTTETTAIERFRDEVGARWPQVSPFCVESSPEELLGLSAQLPGHQSESSNATAAGNLADRLKALLDDWDDLDGSARMVVTAAVGYFLESDDEVHDSTDLGLVDDEDVIRAAEIALGRAG